MEKRSSTVRYSPYPTQKSYASDSSKHIDQSQGKGDEIEEADVQYNPEFVVDEAVSPKEIGEYIGDIGINTNIEIQEVLTDLTNDVSSLDVTEFYNSTMATTDIRNAFVGICVVMNRLLQDNRFLMRELTAVKSGNYSNMARMERYDFKKRLISGSYIYGGCDGIPAQNLMDVVEKFDNSAPRRAEVSTSTIRRFVRFLLENIIPPENHSKFTLRERGGQEYLTELPQDLLAIIRDMCLEALNLSRPRSEEERIRRDDFIDFINRSAKSALQEMRRNPRKPRITLATAKQILLSDPANNLEAANVGPADGSSPT